MIKEILPDNQRVVITGMGAVTPLGLNVPTTWQNILAGQSGIDRISTVSGYSINNEVDIAGRVKGFEPEKYLHTINIRKTHLSSQLALAAATEAGIDAGILDGFPVPEKNRSKEILVNVDPERVSVIIGTGVGGTVHISEIEDAELSEAIRKFPGRLERTGEFEEILKEIGRTPLIKKSPFYVLRMLPERVASVVSLTLGTRGDLYTPVAACATGVRAISEAYKTIRMGDADIIFAGASEASINPVAILSFQLIRALSTGNGEPGKASRPFDLSSDGFVMSEGAGVMVVESLASARRRNARIYAEITGYGNTSDAHHETAPDPEGRSAIRSMREALKRACLDPVDIDHINAHATSTGEADGIELDCYKAVFGKDGIEKIPIVSLKDRLGHMMGSSGAVESILSILTMRDSRIPGMVNLENPRREGFDLVTTTRLQGVRRVLKNSFGFGGINASVVFEKWE